MRYIKKVVLYLILIIGVLFCLSTTVLAAPREGETIEIENSYIDANGELVSCTIKVVVFRR